MVSGRKESQCRSQRGRRSQGVGRGSYVRGIGGGGGHSSSVLIKGLISGTLLASSPASAGWVEAEGEGGGH